MKRVIFGLVVASLLIVSCKQPSLSISSSEDAAKASTIVALAINSNPATKARTPPSSYIFSNYKVVYDGKTYTINGSIDYTYTATLVDTTYTATMTAKSNNLTISGPDLEDTINIDLDSTVTFNTTTRLLTIVVSGTCAGYSVNSTISYTVSTSS